MALTIRLTPGYVWTDNEVVTSDKMNLASNPTVALEGSVSTLAIADGSVTTPKLADGVLSADATGRAKMAASFLSADATGRGKVADGFLTAVKAEETFRQSVAQYAAGVATAGVYAIALSPAATAYTAGMRVVFKPDTISVGGDSINVNGLGDKALYGQAGAVVAAGQLRVNQIVSCVYDGAGFQLENGDGQYVTPETTLASGLLANAAHGLGIAPTMLRWVLRCKSPELGYVAGDEVDAQLAVYSSGGLTLPAVAGGANATNVWAVCAQTTMSVLRKDTFAQANITSGSWKLVGYARR
jgi:hypothetical protein